MKKTYERPLIEKDEVIGHYFICASQVGEGEEGAKPDVKGVDTGFGNLW